MTIEEILKSIVGKQENSNLPNCATNVTTGIYIMKTEDSKEIQEVSVINPVAKIERHEDFVVCDLQYVSAFSQDLRDVNDVFNLYGASMDKISSEELDQEDPRIPYLVITLTAIKGLDNVITLTNPIFWALTSEKPGMSPNIIRALFRAEDVMFYEGYNYDKADEYTEEITNKQKRIQMESDYYDKKDLELKEKQDNE